MATGILRIAGFTTGLWILQPQCGFVEMVVGVLIIGVVSATKLTVKRRVV